MNGSFEESQKELADGSPKTAKEAPDKIGVRAEVLHVPNRYPAKAIVGAAKARDCNLICMSSHGRFGLGRLLLGSQTAEVLAHSPVPVLALR
ncbi:universal stress protein [Pseudogemmobacter sonorensis]|uniref:universal stress protein n=1 Tax=Pseudogemmobacter sonorensis TaxID=2989681 RepID=UPI003680E759